MTQEEQELLLRAAERARVRPEYVGWILARYREIEGLNENQLQEHLRVSNMDWPRLQLCLRPRAEQFLKDVGAIASEFGISRDALAAMVRRVEGMQILAARPVEGHERPRGMQIDDCAGHVLAARSRKQKGNQPKNNQENGHGS